MKTRERNLVTDMAFMLFLILNMTTVLLIINDTQYFLHNLVMLNISFFVLIITYFSTPITSLVLNVLILFGYITLSLYKAVVKGIPTHFYIYFWVVILPAYTLTLIFFQHNVRLVQEKNQKLEHQNSELVSIDELTGLKNIKAFQNDVQIYLKLAVRYELPITCMVIKIRHEKDLMRILGKKKIVKLHEEIAELFKKTFRVEDMLFLVDQNPLTIVSLMLSDHMGGEIAKKRVKETLSTKNFESATKPYLIKPEFSIGFYTLDKKDTMTPLSLYEKALKELAYDIE